MKSKKIVSITLIAICLTATLFAIGIVRATYGGTPTGTISAVFADDGTSTKTLPSTAVGTQIAIYLKVAGGANLWSLKTDIKWNYNVMHLSSVAPGDDIAGTADFLSKNPSGTTLFLGDDSTTWKVDASGKGYVSGGISDTRQSATTTNNVGGNWVTLYFDIVGYGTSTITLSNGVVKSSDAVSATATINSATLTVNCNNPKTLVVTSAYLGATPAGTLVYVSGTSVTSSVTSPVTDLGVTYDCTGWTGTGSATSGSGTTTTFTITADSTITWNWQPQSSGTTTPTPTPTPGGSLSLRVISEHGTNLSPSVGMIGYASGASVTCSITTSYASVNGVYYHIETDGGVQYICTGWTRTGSSPGSGTEMTTTFTITQDTNVTWNWQLLPASLDISTNRGGTGWNVSSNAFAPEEQLTATANVRGPGGVSAGPGRQVTFTLSYATGGPHVLGSVSTDSNGVASMTFRLEMPSSLSSANFGVATLSATVPYLDTYVLSDSCSFMYNYRLKISGVQIINSNQHLSLNGPYFGRETGPAVNVNVTVMNFNWSTSSNDQTNFYLSGTIYDNNKVPISYQLAPQVISPSVSLACNPSASNSVTFTLSLSIPRYAYVGPATVYIDIYSNNPASLSVSYCPEASARLNIEAV